MKVLILEKYFEVSGVATYFKMLIKGLLNDGHTVYLAAMKGDEEVFEEFKSLGIQVINIPYSGNRPGALYQFIKTINKLVKSTDIDIIHSHHRLTHLAAIMVGRRYHIPRLLTFHFINHDHKLISRLWRNQPMTVPSMAFKKHLTEFHGLKGQNIQVIHNTIDSEFKVDGRQLRELKKNVFDEDIFYVSFVGRLSREKGIDVLIKSISLVKEKESDIAFRIFGSGAELNSLKKLCKKNNLDPDELFYGTNFNINELLSLSDLSVIPSRNESFSLFALESLRAGTPVIATNVGGIPEVIEDNETGLLVEPDNPEMLAENILKLYRNEEMRERFSQKGRERFEDKFSVDEFHEAHIQEYRQTIEGFVKPRLSS